MLLSVSISQTHAMHYKPSYPKYGAPVSDPVQDAGKIALGVGCLAAVGYGIYKVCDWLFTPTNEQIIKDSSNTLSEAYKRAGYLIDFFENTMSIPQNIRDQKQVISTVNEPVLYQFSTLLLQRKDSIDGAISTIENTIYYLGKSRNAMADRLKNLYKRHEFPGIISQLESLEQETAQMLTRAEFVREYLATHKKYFSLYERETYLLSAYAQEVDALDRYAGYPDSLRSAIQMCVMKYANMHHASYPYMKYIETINNDCSSLERLIESASRNYANRLNAACLLAQKLRAVYSMLLIADAYHQEMRDYERAQIEKQRVEAERAKAAAAQAQAQAAQAHAAAAQQQVWAMQQQNALQAEKNRIDNERNAIMVAQTLVNAVVAPPAPQYNVFIQ